MSSLGLDVIGIAFRLNIMAFVFSSQDLESSVVCPFGYWDILVISTLGLLLFNIIPSLRYVHRKNSISIMLIVIKDEVV
jgi:pilus assembly protein TadC